MRVAGNKVSDLISFFNAELSSLYSSEEINELCFRVFEHYLHFTRNDFKLKVNENLNQSDLIHIYDAAKRLATSEPLQYVLGTTYFYKNWFKVNKHVLIPRPETEELVELIVNDSEIPKPNIIDFATGSGCIAIALKTAMPNATVYACDLSKEALAVAEENKKLNKVELNIFESDILNLKPTATQFDLIVSNPPYILHSESASIHENVKNNEPNIALFVDGNDSIIFYKKIIDFTQTNLKPGGKLYFELNPLTAEEVKAYAQNKNMFSEIKLINDLSGNVRFLRAEIK